MAYLKSRSKNDIISLCMLLLCLGCVESNDGEGAYMLKLMNALKPPGWSNKKPVCQWTGVYCDYQSGRIEEIDLSSKSLTGTVPAGLNDSLSQLTELDLSQNNLSGPVPSLANLSFLQYVYLGYNNFTSIPHGCFHGLTSLQILRLRNNINLPPWNFPTDLTAHSSQLRSLYLSSTNLMASLPNISHSFPTLRYLDLSNNNLSSIPEGCFHNLTSFRGLSLANNTNLLPWTFPLYLTRSSLQLSYLLLEATNLMGSLPNLSHFFPNLITVSLSNNHLTSIPQGCFQGLPYLRQLKLGNNTNLAPWTFPNLTQSTGLEELNLVATNVMGPLPEIFDSLTSLETVVLSNNSLTGVLPESFGRSKIATLHLNNQKDEGLSGPIDVLSNMLDLSQVWLQGNSFTGPIPDMSRCTALQDLQLAHNQLTGNDFLVLPSNGSDHTPRPIPTALITVISIASAGVIMILVLVIYNRKRCLNLIYGIIFKTTYNDHHIEDFIKGYEFLAPKRFSYSEVKRMTNLFRDKLGQGGYGTVYKARLTNGRQVAVKILTESKGNGEEFINEVASISRTSHVNIVSLLGFCYDQGKRALIYEFMSNGSLDRYIYKAESSKAFCSLDWSILHNIAIGIAQGLEYLHQGCTTKILHLDIKPENILLDEHFCLKISDFGLARICQKKESNVSILGTRGTPGYIAPEIFSRAYGRISDKSDVYSYGMLILEMFGKRNNFNNKESHRSEMYFPDWIYEDLDQGNIFGRHSDISDEDNDMIKKIILVSLWCIQPNPSHRPSMNKVVEMLHGELESVPFPPKPVMYSPERSLLKTLDISSGSKLETISITTEESSFTRDQ
ncbi:uncharacterized protein [Arachis hypogaea]|uniref:uncharacterized protein isoform X3 n=1 Tax=Arachis hypogaea TaxID=3818 RepID=UPI000DED11E0|nr:probable LRR receptor-like serine/threonine-protein kinase At5g16900 isoform X3 [Arachis hypogaea]XP_025697248.1 probable LRR receptor-like serine/threonine-protein kinase At5g16900 isoform X3 [Arachis hypogaea]